MSTIYHFQFSPPPLPTPPRSSQISELFFNHYYRNICKYIYKHTCLHILLSPLNATHMCICLKLTTWNWTTYQGAHHLRRLILFPQHLLIAYSSSFRDGALWDFSYPWWHVIVKVLFRWPYTWDFIGETFLSFVDNIMNQIDYMILCLL